MKKESSLPLSKIDKFAYILSALFNALFTPIIPYILIALLYYRDMHVLPDSFHLIWIIILLLPVIWYEILLKYGKVSDFELQNRKERPLFSWGITFIYSLIFLVAIPLHHFDATLGAIVSILTLQLVGITLVFTLISSFWKISGHIMFLTYSLIATLFLYLTILYDNKIFSVVGMSLMFGIIIISVAWSRVHLKRHTIAQVIAGFFVAFVVYVLVTIIALGIFL